MIGLITFIAHMHVG